MERKGTERKKQEYLITVLFTEKKGRRIEHNSSVQFISVPQSCLTLCDPHGLQHTRLSCP